MKLYYLYGITDQAVEEPPIASLEADGLFGIYEEVDKEFSEEHFNDNLQNQEWVITKAQRHQDVLQQISDHTTVIPLAFGSIFKTHDAILKKLTTQSKEFTYALERLHNKCEWGIKLFYRQDILQKWLLEHDTDLSHLQAQLETCTPGKAFIIKKELERQLKEKLKEVLNDRRRSFHGLISKEDMNVKVNQTTNKELSANPDPNILNLALLSPKAKEAIIGQHIFDFNACSDGIYAELTGPWPPYNFVKDE